MEVNAAALRQTVGAEDHRSRAPFVTTCGELEEVHRRRPTVTFDYSVRKFEVTQQWSSGRCWIFAGLICCA